MAGVAIYRSLNVISFTATGATAAAATVTVSMSLVPTAQAVTTTLVGLAQGLQTSAAGWASAQIYGGVLTGNSGMPLVLIFPSAQARTASLWANIGGLMANRVPLNSLSAGSIVIAGTNTPAVGASVFIYSHGTTTQATIWSAETGSNVIPQPLQSDGNGQLPGWVTSEQVLDVVASYQGVQGPIFEMNPIAGTDAVGNLTPFPASSSMSAIPNELVLMSGNNNTITLPTMPANGVQVGCSSLTGTTTVAAGVGDVINRLGANSGTVTLTVGQHVTLEYNSGAWYTISYVTPSPATAVFTTLPVSPYDGQEVMYLADSTNGIVWHFKYRAGSASTHKWEFVGGSEILAGPVGGMSYSTASSLTTLTSGPSITVPIAGDYVARYGGLASNQGVTATQNMWYVLMRNGADLGLGRPQFTATAQYGSGEVSKPSRANNLAAGDVLTLSITQSAALAVTWGPGWIELIPIRVG